MQWRKRLVAWHRDVGFLVAGLTLAYAISGIAVNHREHWNYNEHTHTTTVVLPVAAELVPGLSEPRRAALRADPGVLTQDEERALVSALTSTLGRPRNPENSFWRGPDALHLYFAAGDRDTVIYHPRSGRAELVQKRDRWFLRDLNFLHLNEARAYWTYIADAFAVALAFLALSGVLMLRGRRGLGGRGAWLLAAGIAVPVLAVILLRYVG